MTITISEASGYFEPHIKNMAAARSAVAASGGDVEELDTCFQACLADWARLKNTELPAEPAVVGADIKVYCSTCGHKFTEEEKVTQFRSMPDDGYYFGGCPFCPTGLSFTIYWSAFGLSRNAV